MSNEDFERKVEFIVEQQAQSTSKIGQLEDLLARFAKATHDRFRINEKRAHEMDERIAALINSQIQTEENLKKTDEQLKQTGEQLKRTDEQLKRTDEQLKRTDEQLKRTDEQLKRTDEQLKGTDEQLKGTDERLKETDEQVKRTGEHLRNLIAVVDRYISERRNGGAQS